MGLFRRIKSAFTSDASRLNREAEAAQEREKRARKEADEAARLIRQLSPRARAATANRAAEQEAERVRQKVIDLARRERQARQQAERAKLEAEELRQKAVVAEGQRSLREQTQVSGREVDAQQRGVRYPSVKNYGTGSSPEWKEFMLLGEPFSRFASSNVLVLQYDKSRNHLYVQFKGGRWYRYEDIPPGMAYEAFIAYSKGCWIWQRIRVVGKGNREKTQKRFTRDAAPPSYLPLTGSAAEYALRNGGM